MAQAVFGEDFEVGLGDNPMAKAIALDEQREQRYLFSAYAADLCFPVAKVMGWGWEDTTVKPGERYLYKVVSLSTDKKNPIKAGLNFVIMGQNTQLVKPQALSVRFGDASAQLSWDYIIATSLRGVRMDIPLLLLPQSLLLVCPKGKRVHMLRLPIRIALLTYRPITIV